MHKIAQYGLLLGAFCLSPWLYAATAPDLYSTEVNVEDQSDSVRTRALQEALTRVIARVSGDPDVARASAGRAVAARARTLVQQFGYHREPRKVTTGQTPNQNANPDGSSEDASPPTDLKLRVSFNPRAVNNALRQAGLPVWGSERPKTMLWLARVGLGAPELIAGEAAEPLRQVAEARGLPIVLPSQDASERQRANAADVIAGYDDRLRAVSRGYGANHLLIAKVSDNGGLWQGQWTLSDAGQVLDEWEDSATTEQQLLSAAMRRTADNYARRYAVASNGTGNIAAVVVQALSSAPDYARVSNYLAGLTVVDALVPALVSPDYVVFRVQLSGGVDVLRRGIGLAGWLAEDEAAAELAGVYVPNATAVGYRLSR